MVNKNVLRMQGYEKEVYKGFEWGMGIERIEMMK